MRPYTILLVPNEEHRYILRRGVGHSRPPVMYHDQRRWKEGRGGRFARIFRQALLLAHEGRPVRAGCDVADDALNAWERITLDNVKCVLDDPHWKYTIDSVRALLAPVGEVIVLDPDGEVIE